MLAFGWLVVLGCFCLCLEMLAVSSWCVLLFFVVGGSSWVRGVFSLWFGTGFCLLWLGCCLGFVIALLGVWFDVRGLPDRFVFLGLVWYRF